MLSAVAFSSVFEHYMGDDTKREKPPAEDSSDEDDKRNSGNLYDKVETGNRRNSVSVEMMFCICAPARVVTFMLEFFSFPNTKTGANRHTGF